MTDTTAKLSIRQQFPILHQIIRGNALVYLDNAATTQKPERVIQAINHYYQSYNSNIHRAAHHLANLATSEYENSRQQIASFIHAAPEEVNLTSGTTESINLVAHSWGNQHIKEGDEILISTMEHHSNIVPWQMLCDRVGATLHVIPISQNGEIQLDQFELLLTPHVKLVSVVHVSNSLGTVNPIKEIIEKAHQIGAKVLIDGAQAIAHFPIDVKELDCDFYAFSGHKAYGPTGTGILYGKREVLENMTPFKGGGEMIKTVSFEKTTYNDIPYKFEAGTPNIAGMIGMAEAVRFIEDLGYETIQQTESEVMKYATEQLSTIEKLRIIGNAAQKAGVISFVVDGIHSYDIGILLDKQGIAIRTGHHCCMPLMDFLELEGTCRISLSIYNTKEDVDACVKALEKAIHMLS